MTSMQKSTQEQLRNYIYRIELLEDEKRALSDQIKDTFSDAKAMGFDPKIMKKVLALRKKGQEERTEEEMLIATYMHALDETTTWQHEKNQEDNIHGVV